jgi:hypothetical protein
MVLKTEHALVGIIIALIVGSGAGYIYGQSPIAGYKEEVDRLKTENLDIREKKAQLLEENIALQDQLKGIKESLNDLESSLEKLDNDYKGLLSTLSILDAKNCSRAEEFELLPGQTQRYEYDVGYGIIWVVEISHTYSSGSRFGWHIGWWQGEQGGEVSGGCDTIEQQLSKVTGTVSTQVYDEGDVLFIRSNINIPEVPRFCRDGSGRLLKKTFEETKIVVNGDFEEPTWNVEGWETSGHLSAGSGEDSLEGRQLSPFKI